MDIKRNRIIIRCILVVLIILDLIAMLLYEGNYENYVVPSCLVCLMFIHEYCNALNPNSKLGEKYNVVKDFFRRKNQLDKYKGFTLFVVYFTGILSILFSIPMFYVLVIKLFEVIFN